MAEVPWTNFAKIWLSAAVACQKMALSLEKWPVRDAYDYLNIGNGCEANME